MLEILVVLIWLVCIGGAGLLAKRKNRSCALWVGLAFFLPPVAVAVLAFLPVLPERERKCPACLHWLPAQDTKCPKCGEILPGESAPVSYRDGRDSPVWLYIFLGLALAAPGGLTTLMSAGLRNYRILRAYLNEDATQAALGQLRSASVNYFEENRVFPPTLHALEPRYIQTIPAAVTAEHGSCDMPVITATPTFRDTGCWTYIYNPQLPEHGKIFLDCTHPDTKGVRWTQY